MVGVTYRVKNVDIIIPPKIVEPTANLDASPAPGPILPIINGIIAIIVLTDVIMIGLNLKLEASLIALSIFLPEVLNWLAKSTIRILFFVEMPINMIKAIWEKILIELFRNKIKTNPPKIAKGTVKIITNGCMNELKVAAITK